MGCWVGWSSPYTERLGTRLARMLDGVLGDSKFNVPEDMGIWRPGERGPEYSIPMLGGMLGMLGEMVGGVLEGMVLDSYMYC